MRHPTVPLVACSFTVGFLATVANAEGRGVRTPQAVEIFNEICAKTYPSFEDAEERALALGFTFEEENPAKDLWVSAFTNADGRSGCSIRYGTVETIPKLLKSLDLLGELQPTDKFSATVQFRDSKHNIEVRVDESRSNGRIMVNLSLGLD